MIHQPRKRFGQNFLQSSAVLGEIMAAINPQSGDNLLEIGPGMGALTDPLLARLHGLTVIEIDRDLQALLRKKESSIERLKIIDADVLTVDFYQFGSSLRLVGNLPYHISTPLLFYLLSFFSIVQDMHFMLQKEVVDRLVAVPSSKSYGRLSVTLQHYFQIEHLFDVDPSAFYPKPKVTSAFIRMTPRVSGHGGHCPEVKYLVLQRLVHLAFGMRRKTLANNLKPLISAAELRNFNVDPQLRPEDLSVQDYANMAIHFADAFEDKN